VIQDNIGTILSSYNSKITQQSLDFKDVKVYKSKLDGKRYPRLIYRGIHSTRVLEVGSGPFSEIDPKLVKAFFKSIEGIPMQQKVGNASAALLLLGIVGGGASVGQEVIASTSRKWEAESLAQLQLKVVNAANLQK